MSLTPYNYTPRNPALNIQAPTVPAPTRGPAFEARLLAELSEIKALTTATPTPQAEISTAQRLTAPIFRVLKLART